MSHLFFSYAHIDHDRLIGTFHRIESHTERRLWIDLLGLHRDAEWETTIERAVKSSYGIIFAVTEQFVKRPFILQKEIPWAVERFNDTRQGKLLFPILFDDVPLPDGLTGPNVKFCQQVIDARDGNIERVLRELREYLPPDPMTDGDYPFVVSWPRLPNFKGREQQLTDLHTALNPLDGKAAIKTAGMYGTGGIGKTQLVVEFAYRYRFYYPGGVYWLNAAADWQSEMAAFATNRGLKPVDPGDSDRAAQLVLAFRDYLTTQNTGQNEALLIMDNVANPAAILSRDIAPKLTIAQLCEQAHMKLILTTRIQTLPDGFGKVEVSKLSAADARAMLLDAWQVRTDAPDVDSLDAIARLFDYLPLPLGWMAAALRQIPDLSASDLLAELRANGVDAVIHTLRADGIALGTPEYYEALVGAGLDWQIDKMQQQNVDAPRLLALLAAYAEAAIIPTERLRLLSGLQESGLRRPFRNALKAMQDYSLVERQGDGEAYRLHPLTRQHVAKKFDAARQLAETAPKLVAAYRNPAVIDAQSTARGFAGVLSDLEATQVAITSRNADLDRLLRLFWLESHRVLTLPKNAQPGFVVQQIRDSAYHESDAELCAACDAWLADKPHLRAVGPRYPADPNLIRVLKGHMLGVAGAIEMVDGRLLSWSGDNALRLWTAKGAPLAVLEGHTKTVNGAIELADGRLFSWSDLSDDDFRLWTADGTSLGTITLEEASMLHNSTVPLMTLWRSSWEKLERTDRAGTPLTCYIKDREIVATPLSEIHCAISDDSGRVQVVEFVPGKAH